MDEYQVGYGKPPRHTRFKKGRSGNPSGRPRKPEPAPIDIVAVLTEPIPVKIGGASREMETFEVWLRGLAKRALTDGNLRAALEFLKVCAKHRIIAPPPASPTGGVVRLPYAEWLEVVTKSLPGTASASDGACVPLVNSKGKSYGS
jgi:hypothetical protein